MAADGVVRRKGLIDLGSGDFHPWRIRPVRHRLYDHPLLTLAPLVELGERLEARGRVRTHADDATAGTSFIEAPQLHPNRQSAKQTLQSIRDAHAWMSLLNVQTDPTYRELVGTVLDDIRPEIESEDPGMCARAGWIFVASPNAVTPFHFDKEHNFILQIQGSKRVYVWDPDDTVVASEHARDHFHHLHSRDLMSWRDEFRERAHVFDLEPGQGAYMPSTSPHMVENGGETSITMSFTYLTNATRRNALLHTTHAQMRKLGMVPPPVGRFPALDAMALLGAKALNGSRALRRRLKGHAAPVEFARFALVDP